MNNIKDIELCKEFIHQKVWRKTPDQREKWEKFIEKLSKLHGHSIPKLVIDKAIMPPRYSRTTKTIYLNKYSVISLLHEFGHHIGLDEEGCWNYSENVFLTAYPKANQYLARNNNHYFVRKDA